MHDAPSLITNQNNQRKEFIMSINAELIAQFDNALGQMSKEITNLFPEGTGYVRIVPQGFPTAGGISLQMDNLWSLELGYLENEVFDENHKYLIRMESTRECVLLSSTKIAFDLNLDGEIVYGDLTNTCSFSGVSFDAGNEVFYKNSYELLTAYSTCSEDQVAAFIKKFLRSWNRTLSGLRAVITQAAA